MTAVAYSPMLVTPPRLPEPTDKSRARWGQELKLAAAVSRLGYKELCVDEVPCVSDVASVPDDELAQLKRALAAARSNYAAATVRADAAAAAAAANNAVARSFAFKVHTMTRRARERRAEAARVAEARAARVRALKYDALEEPFLGI